MPMAKSIVMIALAVLMGGCLLGLFVVGNGLQTANRAQGDGKEKGIVMLRAALTDWDAQAFYDRADDEFRQRNSLESIRAFMAQAKRDFGSLESLGETTLQGIGASAATNRGEPLTVSYTTPAKFQRGSTTARWSITRRKTTWKWSKLTLDAPSGKAPTTP